MSRGYSMEGGEKGGMTKRGVVTWEEIDGLGAEELEAWRGTELWDEVRVRRLKAYRGDFERYCRECLVIVPKKAAPKKLELKATQVEILERWGRKRGRGVGLRCLVLKARQVGASTLAEAYLFSRTALWSHVSSIIAAHDIEATQGLHEIEKNFYVNLPNWMRVLIHISNRREFTFENPSLAGRAEVPGIRSRLLVGNANKMSLGRSRTIHHFHGSEVAYWKDPETVLNAVMQSIPDDESTTVILESTAVGKRGFFFAEWQRAMSGDSTFTPVFIPWYLDPDYRMALPKGEERAFLKDLDPEEKALRVRLKGGMPLEALWWRRYAIEDKCGADLDVFHKEYPSTPEEAFTAKGASVFDMGALSGMEKELKADAPMGTFVVEASLGAKPAFVVDESDGDWQVWAEPENGVQYIIGVDPAQGVDDDEHDWSAIEVLRLRFKDMRSGPVYEQVAEFRSKKVDPFLLGDVAVMAARYFNDAMLCIEWNGLGATTFARAKEIGYTEFYRWRRFDELGDAISHKLNWETNYRTRDMMIGFQKNLIRSGRCLVKSPHLLEEMQTFVSDIYGREEAEEGGHDDLLFAWMMAAFCAWTDMTQYEPGPPKTEEPDAFPLVQDGRFVVPRAADEDQDGWMDF